MEAVQKFSRGESRQLNLGYLPRFNFDLLPATLKTFYSSRPYMAVNLFDLSPAQQIEALKIRKIDLGFVGLRPTDHYDTDLLNWECVAHHTVVVVLPTDHPLAKKKTINLSDLKQIYFVVMSEETHPGSRDWLSSLCQKAGFKPRILRDVALESDIMNFVAQGLGVTLARAHIEKLHHPGCVFRKLAPAAKADHWIAWHKKNQLKELREYVEIVKKEAPLW